MIRRQSKWRKIGVHKGFNKNSKHYEIDCGRCGASLIPKSKRIILADPMPVEILPEIEPLEVGSVTEVESTPKPEDIFEITEPTIATVVNLPPPIFDGASDELLAQYRAFKKDNQMSSWRDAWKAIPNDYADPYSFGVAIRRTLKELKEAGEE